MKTYRDIFKWGDKREEIPDPNMNKLIDEMFSVRQSDGKIEYLHGNELIELANPCKIKQDIILEIEKIVGRENISLTDDERALHSYGKYYAELLKLRLGQIETSPDLVVYPGSTIEVERIVKLCNSNKIPVIPFGGGSSVTGALEATHGGISLDLSKNMNKVLEINELNHTVRVEAGIMGPKLEQTLNSYKSGYTCGHFPQSFEYSTPGGWIAARSAGTLSTAYGKIEDMVLSLKVVCPNGIIETIDYPADAEGVDIKRIFMGSEGIFGIITEACLKIRKYKPLNTKYASFIFKNFESGVEAMRQTMQAGYGKPHLFRLSDPQETDIAFKLKGFNGGISDKALNLLGYKPGQRSIMFVAIEGDSGYPSFVKKNIRRTAKKQQGLYIGKSPTKKWLEQRFSSAYARDPLMDKGLITDTIETAATWQNLVPLWKAILNYLNSRPNTVSMIHISHVYENGANLYITFLSPLKPAGEISDYTILHKGLVDTIVENKGSLSHHHGIGRVLSKWFKTQISPGSLSLIAAIKKELDPNNIMNPGNILGLD